MSGKRTAGQIGVDVQQVAVKLLSVIFRQENQRAGDAQNGTVGTVLNEDVDLGGALGQPPAAPFGARQLVVARNSVPDGGSTSRPCAQPRHTALC